MLPERKVYKVLIIVKCRQWILEEKLSKISEKKEYHETMVGDLNGKGI